MNFPHNLNVFGTSCIYCNGKGFYDIIRFINCKDCSNLSRIYFCNNCIDRGKITCLEQKACKFCNKKGFIYLT